MGWSFDSCFQWHSMVSACFNIPMDGHSMNVRGKEASAWPVWGWSLNDFVSTGITRWCYTRCIWGLWLRVPSQGYRECTIDLLRCYINPMEINKQTKTRPGVFDFFKFGLPKQATWESCTTSWCWFRRTHRYRTSRNGAMNCEILDLNDVYSPENWQPSPATQWLGDEKFLSKWSLLLRA